MCFGTVAASEGSVSELRGESQKTPLSHQPSALFFFFNPKSVWNLRGLTGFPDP